MVSTVYLKYKDGQAEMKTIAVQSTRDTSEKIMGAAKRLFAQYGYHGVSVKQITQEAGANSALVSYHFGGKARLYQTMLEQLAEKLTVLAEKLKAVRQTPLQGILAFLDEIAMLFLQDPDSMHILYQEFLTPTRYGNDVVSKHFLVFYDQLVEVFEYAKEQQSLKPESDSRRTVFVLFSIFSFYLLTYNYEALSESKRLPGATDFQRLHDVCADYLKTISTGKEPIH